MTGNQLGEMSVAIFLALCAVGAGFLLFVLGNFVREGRRRPTKGEASFQDESGRHTVKIHRTIRDSKKVVPMTRRTDLRRHRQDHTNSVSAPVLATPVRSTRTQGLPREKKNHA